MANIDNVTFFLTSRCDRACPYCYQAELTHRTDAPIGPIRPIVKMLSPQTVTFTGGEPLLVKGIIDLLSSVSKYTSRIYLYTNSTNLKAGELPASLQSTLEIIVGWCSPSTQYQRTAELIDTGWSVSAGVVLSDEQLSQGVLDELPTGLNSVFLYYPTPATKHVRLIAPKEWFGRLKSTERHVKYKCTAIKYEPAYIRGEPKNPDDVCPMWKQLVFDPDLRLLPCCLALGHNNIQKTSTGCPILARIWHGQDPRLELSDGWTPICPLLLKTSEGGRLSFPSTLGCGSNEYLSSKNINRHAP